MGIGSTIVNYYLELYQEGFFKNIGHICELGDQEVLVNTSAFRPVAENMAAFNSQESLRMQQLIRTPLVSHINAAQANARWLYQFLGVDKYTCIDINGLNQAIPYDLNKPLPEDHRQYDFITNHGTTEHIFEQFQCFRSIHQLTSDNGYMLHVLPSQDMYDHCFYFYIWNFYRRLADANHYQIHAGYFLPDTGAMPMFQLATDSPERVLRHSQSSAAALMVLLQKKSTQPFRVPLSRALYPSLLSKPTSPPAKIDILLVADHSKQLNKILKFLSLELSEKTVCILVLKEDEGAHHLKKALTQNLKYHYYCHQGYAETFNCRFQLLEMSLSDLDSLPDFMQTIRDLILVPSQAEFNTTENIWDISFGDNQIKVMDLLQSQSSISINEDLLEQAMRIQETAMPEQFDLFSLAKTCVQDILQLATSTDALSECLTSSLEQMWRYLMDCPLDTYAFYRFFPEGWFAIRALLIQEPEHPLGNYLLMLYGRKSASLKPPVPSDTYQNNSLVLKPALEVHINAQILDAVIGFIRTYAIGSVCDLGTIVWVSASDERNTLALRHGLKTPLDSLSVLYLELNLVHQTCELDELGYFFRKPDTPSELVTNYQVSHYIFDQLLIFEAMHDLCAQNGYLLHYLPCDGYSEEGLYLYAWPFYESLAETNNYDICQVLLHLPGHEEQMVELVPKSVPFVLSKLTVKGAYLLVLMRKNTATPFVTPFQTVYRKYEKQTLYHKA